MLLAPSMWHEAGVPLVIGEAFSAGIPVVTCRVKPMDSVVENERNGLLSRLEAAKNCVQPRQSFTPIPNCGNECALKHVGHMSSSICLRRMVESFSIYTEARSR